MINKMQSRGQEIGGLKAETKCVAFKDNICWVFSTSAVLLISEHHLFIHMHLA